MFGCGRSNRASRYIFKIAVSHKNTARQRKDRRSWSKMVGHLPPAGRCSQSLPGLVRLGRGMTKPPAGAEGCSRRLLYPADGKRPEPPTWDTSWRGVPGLPRPMRAGLRHWSSCHPSRAAQAVMRRHRHRPSRSSALHISRTRVSLPRTPNRVTLICHRAAAMRHVIPAYGYRRRGFPQPEWQLEVEKEAADTLLLDYQHTHFNSLNRT